MSLCPGTAVSRSGNVTSAARDTAGASARTSAARVSRKNSAKVDMGDSRKRREPNTGLRVVQQSAKGRWQLRGAGGAEAAGAARGAAGQAALVKRNTGNRCEHDLGDARAAADDKGIV